MSSCSCNTSTGHKPRNLKSSCDFCALSKVKCDRGQPECSRCIRNEVQCHYSETRRIGKIRQLYTTPGRTKPQTNNAVMNDRWDQHFESEPCVNTPRQTSETRTSTGDESESSDCAMSGNLRFDQRKSDSTTDTQASPTQLALDHNIANPYSEPPSNMVSLIPEFSDEFLRILGSQLNTEQEQTGYMNEVMQYTPLDFGSMAEDRAEDKFPEQQTSLDEADCMKRAFATLESLHVPVSQCSRQGCVSQSSTTNMRGLDSTLKVNRTAIDTVLEILSCSCAGSLNIFDLLLLITHQVMDSYCSLSKEQFCVPVTSTNERSSSHAPYGNGQGAVSSISDVPMTIGGYTVDGEVRKKVLTQVLWSEIEKMGRLINTLSSFYAEKEFREMSGKVFIESLQACQKKALQSLIHNDK